jgi:hypothetical protein
VRPDGESSASRLHKETSALDAEREQLVKRIDGLKQKVHWQMYTVAAAVTAKTCLLLSQNTSVRVNNGVCLIVCHKHDGVRRFSCIVPWAPIPVSLPLE